MKCTLPVLLMLGTAPALAETRSLDAHEHGVGALNISVDGSAVAMEFHAPGADIVGFEYKADNAEDRAAIDAAVATLAKPLELFGFPAAAECTVTQASASLEIDDGHDEHDHAEHAETHDDHDHDDHAETKTSHTEFHAEYLLSCGQPDAINEMTFVYFDTFKNALELEIQIVTESGAHAFEVGRDDPRLDLRALF